MYRYLLAILLPLAACATPFEQCVARNSKEMRVVDDLIAVTAGNIERGYAIDARNSFTAGLQLCTSPSANVHFCTATRSAPKKTPVAIDLAAERRKLAQLKARRAELQRQSEQKIAACRAAHPT